MARTKILDSKEFKSEFKTIIESSNLNILLGAGFSYGVTDTLGNTEKVIEAINQFGNGNKYAVIEAWLFWDFFKRTIYPLCNSVNDRKFVNK